VTIDDAVAWSGSIARALLAASLLAIALIGVGTFLATIWPTVDTCWRTVVPQIFYSAPFVTEAEARAFWGQARVLRYLVAIVALPTALAGALTLALDLRTSLVLLMAATLLPFALLRWASERRLYRSRVAGGWG
jgi:hypothetical protein